MSDDPAQTIADVFRKVGGMIDELVGDDLMSEWSEAASALYKEQFALKQNPYGEAWTPMPGDEKQRASWSGLGKVKHHNKDGFALSTARPNAGRSCVPFEPRNLGRWQPKFDEILQRRMGMVFRAVK